MSEKKTADKNRFKARTEGCKGFFTDTKIIVDKETGVQYLFVQEGYSGGLTVLLGSDGKPLLAK